MVSTEPKVDARQALREAMRQDPNLAEAVSELVADAAPAPLVLPGDWELTDERLAELVSLNEGTCFEIEADGSLSMSPAPYARTAALTAFVMNQIAIWMGRTGRGLAIGPDGGYRLPRSLRAPDGCWLDEGQKQQLRAASAQEYPVMTPAFVQEVRSMSDRLPSLQAKMEEWVASGARLAWLVDPIRREVHVYRADASVEVYREPLELGGGDVMPGLVVDFSEVWEWARQEG